MYDLAIIGAGAGGIACAKQALKAGLKTVLIDRAPDNFGGTCINSGCIPTKLFLNQAKLGKQWSEAYGMKSQVIAKIKDPLLKYLSSQGLTLMWGEAYLVNNNTITLGAEKVEAKYIILANGSLPRTVAQGDNVVTAQDIFSLATAPDKVLVIGAGYIGIEVASLLRVMGSAVTVVEKEDRILPGFDTRLANRFRIALETKGISINTSKVFSDYNLADFDLVVTAAGLRPNTAELGLEKAGVKIDERGWVITDNRMRTNVDNIYACGDVTGKMMLAYTAEHQAEICVKNITRSIPSPFVQEDYTGLARCVFSIPQIACVGVSEEEAKARGIKYRVVRSNFMRFSAPYVYGDTDGYIQIILDEQDIIIGADLISNAAGELISILSTAIVARMGADRLAQCLFVHPTLSEVIPMALRE